MIPFPKGAAPRIADVIYRFESGTEPKQEETCRRSEQDRPVSILSWKPRALEKEPDKKVSFSDQRLANSCAWPWKLILIASLAMLQPHMQAPKHLPGFKASYRATKVSPQMFLGLWVAHCQLRLEQRQQPGASSCGA